MTPVRGYTREDIAGDHDTRCEQRQATVSSSNRSYVTQVGSITCRDQCACRAPKQVSPPLSAARKHIGRSLNNVIYILSTFVFNLYF